MIATKKVAKLNAMRLILFRVEIRLFLEEILNGLVRDHTLIKDVSTCLGALHHLDDL